MSSKVNLDTADRLDITCRQGDTFELTVTLKDSAGTGLKLATDSYGFLMQVRSATASRRRRRDGGGGGEADSDDALIVDGGFANTGDIVIGSVEAGVKGLVNFEFKNADDSGNVTIFLSASEMRKVRPGRYKYDFQYRTGDTQKTVLEGTFKVNADISKAL